MSLTENIQQIVLEALEQATFKQYVFKDIQNHDLYSLLDMDGAEDLFFSTLHAQLGILFTRYDYQSLEEASVSDLVALIGPMLERAHSNYLTRISRSQYEAHSVFPRYAAQGPGYPFQ